MEEVDARAEAILPYPWQNALTRGMRTAASKAGKAEYLSLWAGRNVRLAREMPAGKLVAVLAKEAGLL
jgi:nitronate monooxygenase